MDITILYFSACGNTKHVASELGQLLEVGNKINIIDGTLLTNYSGRGDIIVLAAPVYEDMPPKPFIRLIDSGVFEYKHSIVIQTYGGVTAKRSLAALISLISTKGIPCIGAAIIETNHSYITLVEDKSSKAKPLLKLIKGSLSNMTLSKAIDIKVRLNFTLIKRYIAKRHDELFPQPHRDECKCTKCKICTAVCPATSACISCQACVKACPNKALVFSPKKLPIIGISAMKLIKNKHKIYI